MAEEKKEPVDSRDIWDTAGDFLIPAGSIAAGAFLGSRVGRRAGYQTSPYKRQPFDSGRYRYDDLEERSRVAKMELPSLEKQRRRAFDTMRYYSEKYGISASNDPVYQKARAEYEEAEAGIKNAHSAIKNEETTRYKMLKDKEAHEKRQIQLESEHKVSQDRINSDYVRKRKTSGALLGGSGGAFVGAAYTGTRRKK